MKNRSAGQFWAIVQTAGMDPDDQAAVRGNRRADSRCAACAHKASASVRTAWTSLTGQMESVAMCAAHRRWLLWPLRSDGFRKRPCKEFEPRPEDGGMGANGAG